jgi:8-oxo-dGTP pyrophosphatase MutT (NUDIX family)
MVVDTAPLTPRPEGHHVHGPQDLASLVSAYAARSSDRSIDLAIAALGTRRPMWPRSEFRPGHFTASGFVASPDRACLLLVWHAKIGRWLQPGGHIEPNDATVEEAIRREVTEETGLSKIQPIGRGLLRIDAHEIPAHAGEPSHLHIDLAMGFIASKDAVIDGEVAMTPRWVPFEALAGEGVDAAVLASAERLAAVMVAESPSPPTARPPGILPGPQPKG